MRKIPLFYKIYVPIVLVFAIIITGAMFMLNGWLSEYESAQPESLINEIIENTFKKNNLEAISDITTFEVSPYEKKENVYSYLSALTKDKVITSSSTINQNEAADLTYIIKAGEEKVLYVFLKKNETSSDLLSTYKVIGATLPDELYKAIEISIPADAEVTINGIALKEEDKKAVEIPTFPEQYKQGVSCGSTAKIEKLISDDVTVTATYKGKELPLTKNGNTYSFSQYIDEETLTKVGNFAKAASETYSAYMQNDSSMTAIKKYFATDTQFYSNLRQTDVIFALDHDGYRFENTEVKETYRYSDNLYRCRVTLTQILVKGRTEYTDYFDKYVYVYVNGDTLTIIDLTGTGDSE